MTTDGVDSESFGPLWVRYFYATYAVQTPVMGKSEIKSNHDVNQMKTVTDSTVYAWNVINVHLNIWPDGNITEINSLTQLQ